MTFLFHCDILQRHFEPRRAPGLARNVLSRTPVPSVRHTSRLLPQDRPSGLRKAIESAVPTAWSRPQAQTASNASKAVFTGSAQSARTFQPIDVFFFYFFVPLWAKPFFSIFAASGLRYVHFTNVKCKNPKSDLFLVFICWLTFNIIKIELSCRRELDFDHFAYVKLNFFAKCENVISGLPCKRELDFDVLQ